MRGRISFLSRGSSCTVYCDSIFCCSRRGGGLLSLERNNPCRDFGSLLGVGIVPAPSVLVEHSYRLRCLSRVEPRAEG